ncbi:MAG: OmpH family outer membrane protein [Bacteroidales bacterium]|nr:OmpH family outer membrane protein [Bacteroidales bacterium]MBN2697313.1 OmpH family outer membrane protein [Bacteroidales bacterium]
MKKIALILGSLLFSVTLFSQNLKFGHISSDLLLSAMPEYDSAQVKIDDLREQYDLEIERIQVEINKKIDEFTKAEKTMSELIKEAKASEIQEMQVRLQNFAQTAQQDLQQKSMTFIQPVMEKARTAIEEVAKEQGLLYVFDMSQGNPIYASDKSVDLLPLVKANLGLQ